LRGLPPGAYYLAALTDLAPANLQDPSFLDEMAKAAVRVDLADGQVLVQDLRIARVPSGSANEFR
jgi:hypothetical protein